MKRFLKFRIRTILLWMAIFGAAIAWYSSTYAAYRAENEIIEELDLEGFGGLAVIDSGWGLYCPDGSSGEAQRTLVSAIN